MSTSAQYATAPGNEYVQISSANTNRDGTGSLGTVCSGPATTSGAGVGKRLRRITITATGTTTAGMVRFFISNDNGTTKRLIYEQVVSAITVGASTAGFTATPQYFEGMVLGGRSDGTSATNVILYASTHNAETFNIVAEWGTF
jgi:hypothetical protein